MVVFNGIPVLLTAFTLLAYAYLDDINNLTADKAFFVLTLMQIQRIPLALLPIVINYLSGVCFYENI